MKTAAMLALAAMLSVTCASAAGKKTVKFRTVHQSGFAAYDQRSPHVVLATTAAGYRQTWTTLVGTGEPPAIDFAKEIALFLFAGTRNSGGYAVNPSGVTVSARKATISATVKSPGKGSMVTQVITSPFAIVAMPKTPVASATWVDSASGTAIASTATPSK